MTIPRHNKKLGPVILSENATATIPDEVAAQRKALVAANREEDLRKVRGIFKNLECSGGSVRFSHRKYKGEPVTTYTMEDGKEYEVPLYIAKHLNNGCSYPVHSRTVDSEGKPVETIGKMVNRFAFLSTEFR